MESNILQTNGVLTARDFKRHIPHAFAVPDNCTALRIYFEYAPPRVGEIRNMLTLTLFDPHGFRGAGHRHGDVHRVEIGLDVATPGYHPGPLPGGEWIVQIDTHMIMPGPDCPYSLRVEAELGSAQPEAAQTGTGVQARPLPRFDFVANTAPGWYRGDLHAHTRHSDASWDVADLLASARGLGLDFVTLTDHNTTTPLVEFAAASAPDLLTMGGMELTTFWGHAVCLGANDWIDWRVDKEGVAMNRIAQEQYAAGNLFIIAHPESEGDPICTGCRWVYPQMRPGAARFVEVWNGRWGSSDPRSQNEAGLGYWYDWLNRGLRMIATAGTDAHGPNHHREGAGFNVVYAQNLSQRAILDGLRRGQSYLSAGVELSFCAQDGRGNQVEIGGTMAAQAGVRLVASWRNAPEGARLRLIDRGQIHAESSIDATGETSWTLDTEPGGWAVIELRRADGWMWGLTNPVFFE